jgi:tetratricopeptide (TPR) repeat protein
LRLGRHEAVGDFLAPYLDAAPRFSPLHESQAVVLYRLQDFAPALDIADRLRVAAPNSVSLNTLRAALLVEIGRYEAALEVYADLLEQSPDQPRLWISRGHVLKTLGRQTESVAAYQRSRALNPGLGEAYWSLANLKVVRFDETELTQMRRLLGQEDLRPEDRVPLHFALAKALEDDLQFEESFVHYQRGAALRRAAAPYDADAHHARVRRLIQTFTPAFFAARAGSGARAPDPIFIVGLPRSGSTLIEQMLASHSSVEATAELSDLTVLARALARRLATSGGTYPAALAELDVSVFAELGEAYLARTQLYRRSDRPYFIDKFPTNFMHLGLIHLILPHAKIIDARRHPMACGLSVFKQNFAQGQAYSRDLTDLGRYYADYVKLMAHFDQVLPGRVHRVLHESLVETPEAELRRLLDYCGLPFEAACLRFHDSTRPVRTASSEQVRRPISREGVDHWRHFEPWLGPLKAALGPGLAD